MPKKSTPRPATTFRDRIVALIWVAPDRLREHPENWRIHPDAQRVAFRGVLAEIGIADAVIVFIPGAKPRAAMLALPTREERAAWLARYRGAFMTIDGHLRREELRQDVAALVLDVDPDEARKALASHDAVTALASADPNRWNALATAAPWSEETTRAALSCSLLRYELPLPGLPPAPAVAPPSPEDEEEPVVPTDALVQKWGTEPGQLWVVPSLTVPGREHRLLCGDCRDPANVTRLHEGRRPAFGLHDPPYGVNAVDTTRETLADGRKVAKTRSSSKSFEPVHEDDRQFSPVHLLGSSARLVLWGANNYAHLLPPSAEWIMWSKRTGMAESTFSDGELAWVSPEAQGVGHVRGIWHTWSGANRASETEEAHLHPTQKPVGVQRAPIEWYSKPGDLVADWYMGAGAVIIACEQTGRIGHGMDIAHAYLAATLERLAARGLTPRRVE